MGHRLAPRAKADLEELAFYVFVETGSVETANRLVDSIIERFVLLGTHPSAGRRRDDLRPGIRSFQSATISCAIELKGTTWEKEEARYVKHLLSICDRFAPNTSDCVVETFTLTPPGIERYFGITRGHIHHVDNAFGFADRLPYVTPVAGLYSCSAGCHPAGSVIGAAGHNAAVRVLEDLGKN